MDNDAAWRVIQTAFRCGTDLQGLLRHLKGTCRADEYQAYALGIAAAVDCINVQLTDRVLKVHPELAAKIESELAKLGQITYPAFCSPIPRPASRGLFSCSIDFEICSFRAAARAGCHTD